MANGSQDTFYRKSFLGALAALLGGCSLVSKALANPTDALNERLRTEGKDPRFEPQVTDYRDPGYGTCARCAVSWRYVDPHVVDVVHGLGLFALCERCWNESSIEERVAFYVACCYMQAFDVQRDNKRLGRHDALDYTPEQVREAVLHA